MAESLPTSVSTFNHRRHRADSVASFSFYQEEYDGEDAAAAEEDRRLLDRRLLDRRGASAADLDELPFEDELEDEESSADLERQADDNDYVLHRRASTQSRGSSVHSRLLRRTSVLSGGSGYGGTRSSQKIYMANEDLYVAIAGFRTSSVGLAAYIFICVATLGLGWLVFRWIPRWHVNLVGKPSPLRDCQWVVVEVSCIALPCGDVTDDDTQNSWNEMAILDVDSRPFGRPISMVFGAPGKTTSYMMDEDPDPILQDLRTLNYRYVRFYFHPLTDKFVLCNGWKDPLWSDVRAIRAGIDSEEKSHRDLVFGNNLIDIEQKSIFRLLVDEVSVYRKRA